MSDGSGGAMAFYYLLNIRPQYLFMEVKMHQESNFIVAMP